MRPRYEKLIHLTKEFEAPQDKEVMLQAFNQRNKTHGARKLAEAMSLWPCGVGRIKLHETLNKPRSLNVLVSFPSFTYYFILHIDASGQNY